jgi:hypothetical protein
MKANNPGTLSSYCKKIRTNKQSRNPNNSCQKIINQAKKTCTEGGTEVGSEGGRGLALI